jgi:hypothetical protein
MRFIVTALTADLCEAVQIRPETSFYPAIYSRIFGPATHAECAAFVDQHTAQCQKGEAAVALLSAEDAGRPFPWSAPWDSEAVTAITTEMAASVLPGGESVAGKVLVSRVEGATFAMQLSFPPTVVVQAWGQVPTLGYSDGEVKIFDAALPVDGVVTAGVFAKPPAGFAAQMLSSVPADGNIPFNGDAIQAIHLVGSQGTLLCLPGPNGPFSRQVDGSRLVRGTGEILRGVTCYLIVANRDTYSIGTSLPAGCADGDRVHFTGVRMDVSFCMQGIALSLLWAAKV